MPDGSHASMQQGFVAITMSAPDGTREVVEQPLSDFEHSEQGIAMGRRVVPWHRVHRVSWLLAPRQIVSDEPLGRVRVVIDDGTPSGEEFVVDSERFEANAWSVAILLDDGADADAGTVTQRRLIAPLHAVFEYERLASELQRKAEADARPDAYPSRPDS